MSLNVTCPHCQTTIEIEDAIDAEAEPHQSQADSEPLVAQLVEEEADPAPEGGPFDPDVCRIADDYDPERTSQQRIVSALLLRSLEDCKPTVVGYVASVITAGLLIPLFLGVGFFVVMIVYYPLVWADHLFGDKGASSYLLLLGLLLVVAAFKKVGQEEEIVARRKEGRIAGLKLGRLHDTFSGGASTTLLLLGLVMGWHAGLLFLAPKVCGLSFEPSASQAWFLALDTVTLGKLGDVLDALGGAVPRHDPGFWSDVVFQVFQAADGAMIALFAYQLYQKWKLRRLLDGLPTPFRGAGAFARWVDDQCRNDRAWPRQLFDELMFLSVASLYVNGHWGAARELTRRFPWMRVAPDVRGLLLDRQGKTVFPPD
jgi:hypothetical protein